MFETGSLFSTSLSQPMFLRQLLVMLLVLPAIQAADANPIVSDSTIAIYDAPTDTGTPIFHENDPNFIKGTFRGIPNTGFADTSINNSGEIIYNATFLGNDGLLASTLVSSAVDVNWSLAVSPTAGGAPRYPIITNDGAIVWHKSGTTEITVANTNGTLVNVVQDQALIGNTGFTFGSTTFLRGDAQSLPPAASNTHVIFQAAATNDRFHCVTPFVCYSGDSQFATIRYTRETGTYDILTRAPEGPQPQTSRFVENLENVDVNDSGTLAFMGSYNPPGDDPPGFSGLAPADTVWAIAVGDELSTARVVAQGGTEAPGTGGRLFEPGLAAGVQTTPGPALNNNDQIAFKAPLTGGVPNMNPDAVFFDDGVTTSLIATWGGDAPGGSTFGHFGNVQLSDNGQLAFTAGADVSSSRTNETLYATDESGRLTRILSAGQDVQVVLPDGNSAVKQLARIDLSLERESTFNSEGTLVVAVSFSDSSKAILAFDLAPDNADFDQDADVDGADFLIWQRGFGRGTTRAEGDANGNRLVDSSDLAIWKNQFGDSIAASSVAVIPEPSSVTLAILALFVAGTLAHRDRQRLS